MGSKSSRDRTEFNGDDEVALHNQEAKVVVWGEEP